ncbi:methyl-accepting chemotaxis protein [Undibacterium flavidum]|uniref:MCP four helix bundle domain-containing protein n=1 Tax=Undibacterium flavidum TaxID=2762297 RepID=A0ABR6YB39_9BURK|nr:methyl-accepting chemotaxis protein [Undibacterium flavidum]MBC3873765.1 MCP four helix bundle domain-containing protein [Undibacterium flavidum]
MNFSNLKIGFRLVLSFSIVLILSIVIGTFSISRLASVNNSTAEIATNWLVATRTLGDYRTSINVIRRSEAQHIMSMTEAEFLRWEKRIEEAKAKAAIAFKAYADTVTSADERALLESIKVAEQRYFSAQVELLKTSRATDGVNDSLRSLYNGSSLESLTSLLDAISKSVEYQSKGADAAYQSSQDLYASARLSIVALLICSVAIGAVLALLITRSITGPVGRAVALAEAVAAGDLTNNIVNDNQDEIGQLLRAMMKMNNDLALVVSNVRTGSESVATASAEIAQGNLDLSSRTEEQASSLEETAASMEELSSTVSQNADNSRQANQLAQSASGVAKKGGSVVAQVVETMKGINDSSRKIVDIISVIDGIAFQTNILALNAAVEAARAGEQGRGFAVVASEVRTLAQRSAAAAKEIKELIGASVDRVEQGTILVDQAGVTMAEVVQSIEQVANIMHEISAASTEQSQGVSQVGEAVTQMDEVTQQNAALVEEMAAAANGLENQAKDLVASVAVFKLQVNPSAQSVNFGNVSRMSDAKRAPTTSEYKKSMISSVKRVNPTRKLASTAISKSDNDDWEAF